MEYKRYLIGFSDDQIFAFGGTPKAKQRFIDNAIDHYSDFHAELHKWIFAEGLGEHLQELSEPLMFPILSIRCTEQLAKRLEQHPQIEFIRPDGF